jgi:hypothetical protein
VLVPIAERRYGAFMTTTRQPSPDPVGELGELLMKRLRDRGIDYADALLASKWKAPSLEKIQRDLQALSPEQQSLVRRTVMSAMDHAVHDFLFALQEQHENDGHVAVVVGGENVAAKSDGLHGELFGDAGWFARFSAHGEPRDEA